jgi:hypothetical protein
MPMGPYNSTVRRLLFSLVIVSFAISLHASVPFMNSAATRLNPSAKPQFESTTQGRSALEITAAPANDSFYDEFYSAIMARQAQPKTGMLHWVSSLIKKGRQKIALLSPQKFF